MLQRRIKLEGILLVLGLPGPTVHCTVCPESEDGTFLVHLVPRFWSTIEAWTDQTWGAESFGILYDDRYHPADTYKLQCKPFSGMRQGSLIPEALGLRLARLPHKYQYWELQWKDVQHSGKLGFPSAQQTGWQEASHTETCLQDVTRCWLKYSGDNF